MLKKTKSVKKSQSKLYNRKLSTVEKEHARAHGAQYFNNNKVRTVPVGTIEKDAHDRAWDGLGKQKKKKKKKKSGAKSSWSPVLEREIHFVGGVGGGKRGKGRLWRSTAGGGAGAISE